MKTNDDSKLRCVAAGSFESPSTASLRATKRPLAALSITLSATVTLAVGLSDVAAAHERTAGERAPDRAPAVQVAGFKVKKIGPGRLNPRLGGFVVNETDVAEVSLSREHMPAGNARRHLADRDDLSVFGVGWQAEFLGGITGYSLKGTPAGLQVLSPYGKEHRYRHHRGNIYRAKDGSQIQKSDENLLEEKAGSGLIFRWAKVTGQWRVTAVGTQKSGMDRVYYDAHGRVARITVSTRGGRGTGYADITYAQSTTAGANSLGDIQGMVKSISYAADLEAKPMTVATYQYDQAGRLAAVAYPRDGHEANYAYDQRNRLIEANSPMHGSWTLHYSANSDIPSPEEKEELAASLCGTASSYMWGQSGCWVDPVAHYGWKSPSWKQTATGWWVVGIFEDHCSDSDDQPGLADYDFRPACDMHDYGYGVIATGYLRQDQKSAVDHVFYTTLKDYICPAYEDPFFGANCETYAYAYWTGVRAGGDPANGAKDTCGSDTCFQSLSLRAHRK